MEATPPARAFWDRVPNEVRVRILNNVYCCECKRAVGIAIERMSIKEGNLILEGTCTTCNGPVARLIEGS